MTNREIAERVLADQAITPEDYRHTVLREGITDALDAKDQERANAVTTRTAQVFSLSDLLRSCALSDPPHVCTMVPVEWITTDEEEADGTHFRYVGARSKVTTLACTAPDCGRTKAVG